MIKNEFEHFEGAVAKAACKRDAGFVIHTLDHGTVTLSLGAEVGPPEKVGADFEAKNHAAARNFVAGA